MPTATELNETRELVETTQAEVAEGIGGSRASLSHWESGAQRPKVVLAKLIRNLYADRFDEDNIIRRSSRIARSDVIRRRFGLPTRA